MTKFNRFSGYEYMEHFKDGGAVVSSAKSASNFHTTTSKPVLIHEPTAMSIEESGDSYRWKALGSDYYHKTKVAQDIQAVKQRRSK